MTRVRAFLVGLVVLAGACTTPVGSRGQATSVTVVPATTVAAVVDKPAPVPGATDPRVTQANIASTICAAGYSTSVRPSSSITSKIKRDMLKALPAGADRDPSHYQLDHAISLEVGGQPIALNVDGSAAVYQPNLWLQPVAEAKAKDDDVEDRLHALVCAGRMTLREAQQCEWPAWRACARTIQHKGG